MSGGLIPWLNGFWKFLEGHGQGSDSVGNGYRLYILGDLNGWIGDRTRAAITGAFGVPGENDDGKRVVEFSEER